MSEPQEEHALAGRMGHEMILKLAANRTRPHWRQSDGPYLCARLREEVDELLYAVIHSEDAWQEAADVANFAAMIADNHFNGRGGS